uniref:Uncharacterized protein n=1 Tax=Nicotiana tabacum TaxID=4097 RepID=A0A1S3Z3I4_TOBAC|nr:PREDICTED: uncharacterized protein LOC107782610 [Nicotiana tabacum]
MTIEFSSLENKLNNPQVKLKDVQDSLNANLFNPQLINEERESIIEPPKWEAIQEKVLKQNSGATWIACGDNLPGEAAQELSCIDPNIIRDGPCLTLIQQQQLLKPVSKDKILQAFRNMHTVKAPGISGFPVKFFKEFWPLIREDIIIDILQFFQNGNLLKAINFTTITLVPKVPNPTCVLDKLVGAS